MLHKLMVGGKKWEFWQLIMETSIDQVVWIESVQFQYYFL